MSFKHIFFLNLPLKKGKRTLFTSMVSFNDYLFYYAGRCIRHRYDYGAIILLGNDFEFGFSYYTIF